MEEKRKIFNLNELDDTFWSKVIYVEIWHSSGLGGPGSMWIITSDKKLFQIGFITFPYNEFHLDEYNIIFNQDRYDIKINNDYLMNQEDDWIKLIRNNVWMRKMYYDEYRKEYEKEKERQGYVVINWKCFFKSIGIEENEERFVECNLAMYIEEEKQEYERRKEKGKKLFLSSENLTWKPLYYSNCKSMILNGEYSLVLSKNENGIKGYKYSIIYQREETEPFHIQMNAPIEMYILFERVYTEIHGPYYYPNPKIRDINKCDEDTFNNYDINNYGRFVRAFRTLEEATNYVIYCLNNHGINIKNLYIPVKDND